MPILHAMFQHLRFQNFERLLKAPFIIYKDFESILKPVTYNNGDDPNTKKIKITLFTVMTTNYMY